MDNGAQYSESLARLRTRTIEQCLEAQRRTGRRLVFALDTALSLQGIELPRYRRGGLLADTLHAVIESNGVRTILQGICFGFGLDLRRICRFIMVDCDARIP